MLLDRLKNIRIVLGSQSPRRKELLAKMGVSFEVIVKETDEAFDVTLSPEDIVTHIAMNKLAGFVGGEFESALVITADTIVVNDGVILNKPGADAEAMAMLTALQGKTHQVMTAVGILYKGEKQSFVETTTVTFAALDLAEIGYYVENFKPMDKAGAYGIQEWIGLVGVEKIIGAFENVVGLPTARLYKELKNSITRKGSKLPFFVISSLHQGLYKLRLGLEFVLFEFQLRLSVLPMHLSGR